MQIVHFTIHTEVYKGYTIVKISDVGQEFLDWLKGQTCPVVLEDAEPTDWAYYGDYSRFINKQLIID